MLDVKIGTKGQNYVKSSGEFMDILYDVSHTVMSVHKAMAKADPEAAEAFRYAIQKMVTDPDFWKLDIPSVTIARSVRRSE